jgi:nucleotide-binding universal stress UspA family protein
MEKPEMFERILLAVGGQEASEPARLAGRLCRELGARLTIVTVHRSVSSVYGEPDYSDHLIPRLREADEALERAVELIRAEGLASEPELERLEGEAADRIVELAHDRGFDLIVMGTRRRGRIGAALMGSVSQSVAARSGVPVLVVPERPTSHGGGGK